MIEFLKENGYPETIYIHTIEHPDENGNIKDYTSIIMNHGGDVIKDFTHVDLRARLYWIDGYFTALRLINKKETDKVIIVNAN